MASEYLKWKYRDVQPEQKRTLTPEERRANWWHYHKWHVILGGILLAALVNIVWHMSGMGTVEPDCRFAYVGSRPLPEETVSALETALSALAADRNGDGKAPAGDSDAAMYAYAASVRLMADLQPGTGGVPLTFFLLEDPETFQANYEILSAAPPLLWTDCPVLAALPLGTYRETLLGETVSGDSQSLLAGVYLARRVPPEEGEDAWTDSFWETLTEGAVS